MTSIPLLSKLALSVGNRLLLINALLLAALLTVAMMSWQANDAQRKAMAELTSISRAARYHQDADTQTANLRADVSLALSSSAYHGMTHEAVLAALTEDSNALRQDIRALDRMALPAELTESLGKVRDLTDAYRAQAIDTATALLANPGNSGDLMPRFESAFSELQAAMLIQTGVLARRIVAADAAADDASREAKRWLLGTAVITSILVCGLVALLSASIRRSLRRVRDVAKAIADGNLAARADVGEGDEVGALGGAMNQLAENLSGMMDKLRLDAERDAFTTKLVEALEMADAEGEAYETVGRVMTTIAPDLPMELLIADSSRAHLERATSHPVAGSPGCSVESPFSCVAVRRGAVTSFPDSEEVNACPRLRGRSCGPVSAVCIPLSFMGRSMGVLHVAGPRERPATAQQVVQLSGVAQQAASRVGTLRAFQKTQRQASTDSLTGLMNRRSMEDHIRSLVAAGQGYALVMCDLDNFKRLNDTHGHEAGDQALRLFAEVLRASLRDLDVPARWGGEEFVIVMAKSNAAQAAVAVDRLRAALAEALLCGSSPVFTASFGIADTSMAGQLDELSRLADDALYQAKEQGRDRWVIATNRFAAKAVPRRDAEHLVHVDLRMVDAQQDVPGDTRGERATAERRALR